MALLSDFPQLNPATDTFADWLNRTNDISLYLRGEFVTGTTQIMTANSLPGGSMTYGNATLFGQFTANTMVVINNGRNDGTDDNVFGNNAASNTDANVEFGGLRGGFWDNSQNTITADTLYIVSNTTFTPESTEVYVNSTYGLIVENTTELRYDVLYVGDGPAGSNTNAQLHWQSSNNQLNFNDDVRATFGGASGTEVFGGTGQYEMFYSAADNRMYSNTDIQDIRSTANLNLITDRYELRTETGGENMMTANLNGEVVLYWDNAARLTTNTYGVTVHGDAILEDDLVIFDGNKILMGGNTTYDGTQDLTTYKFQMFTDGSDAFIKADDRDLYLEVKEGFELTNIGRTTHYMTANATGENEVALFAAGTERLSTIDSASDADNSPDGVEIYGEANTTTLRVQSDANYDNTTLNSNSVHWDATNEIWNYRDNVKATWGDGDDLEIYYTGTRGNVNTDILDVRGSTNTNIFTDDFEMRSDTGNELLMTANVNNGVELYHNNIKKVSSNTYGVEVYGQVLADNGFVTYNNQPIEMGGANYAAAHNFTIVTDGTDTTITETSNDLSVRVEDNFRVTDDTGTTSLIVANTSGEVTLYHNNNQKMQTNAYGVEITGEANTVTLRVLTDANFDGSTGLDSNNISWDASANTLYLRDNTPIVLGDGNDLTIKHDGSHSLILEGGTGNLYIEGTNLVLRATDNSRYLEGIDGSHVIIYSPDDTPALLANNNQVHITDLANTNTLRVRSTSLFEDDIDIEGSTGNPTLTWDKSANTLNFDDNNYITMGTGGDFTMYHEGSNTYIREEGAGDLVLQANNMQLEDTSGLAYFCGTAGQGASMHFNGDQKLITRNDGIEANGIVDTDTLLVTSYANFEADVYFDGTTADAMHWESTNNLLNFNDGIKATFGTGDDLQIYHNGSHSYIDDAGTGNLYIRSNDLNIQKYTGEEMIRAIADGAVTLFHNNSAKLATTATGVNVTGTVVGTGLDINGSSDLGASGSDTISMIGVVDTNIVPTGSVDLGTSAAPWTELWVTNADVQTLQVDLNATITGEVTANNFVGDGAQLTAINASELTTGTVNDARLPGTISSDITGTAAQSNTIQVHSSGASEAHPVIFIPAGSTTNSYQDARYDTTFVFNASNNTLTVDNLIVDTAVTLPSDLTLGGTTQFESIDVSANLNANVVIGSTFEIPDVGFSGSNTSVSTTAATVIDSFPIGQTKGFKYFVHGDRSGSSDSAYVVEINVGVTDNGDVYYTRYGEIVNDMAGVSLVPSSSATHVSLIATCTSASGSNVHNFTILKIETRS